MLKTPEWVTCIAVGAIDTNAYLLEFERETWLIDPGGEGTRLAKCCPQDHPLTVYLTHGHADHWAGLAMLLHARPETRWFYPSSDGPLIKEADPRFLAYLGEEAAPENGIPLDPPLDLSPGNRRFSLFAVPGHTPGHIALLGEGILFGGDLLFAGGVGRTDFPGSSPALLRDSLAKLLTLPDETLVCPGHGSLTTIQSERRMIESLLA
jgi:hydroxyacylglutathione hydrolase